MRHSRIAPRPIALAVCFMLFACDDVPDTSSAVAPRQCASLKRPPVPIPAGTHLLGDTRFYPEEGPVIEVTVAAFDIDVHEVSNREFAEFVAATQYVTRAERGLPEAVYDDLPADMRRPGSAVFQPPTVKQATSLMSWWTFVEGASWKAPQGPGSSIDGMDHYPVVHIAFEDAKAYAAWRGRRLPTEAEWEVAARGGLIGAAYAWGESPPDQTDPAPANTWQGLFPYVNQASDGYSGTAPVGCYSPNAYGLFDMTGNVWEWTADTYVPRRTAVDSNAAPDIGTIKGGSYLCADNFCQRYRPAARQSQERLFSASHIGFRTVSVSNH